MSREVVIGMKFLRSRETKEAVYASEVGDGLRWVFLPKSQIEYVRGDDGIYTVTMPRWLAKEKKLG